MVIAGILNSKKEPSFFNSVPSEIRARTSQVTTKICCTLIAGTVAEAIHKQGIEYNGELEIGFADPDADGIDACEYIMQIIDNPKSQNYIIELVRFMTAFIRSNEQWQVISELAEALVITENKKLLKNEIEVIFAKNNFKRNRIA